MYSTLCYSFKNASLWPPSFVLMDTTILTTHEPSELVAKCIFCALKDDTDYKQTCHSENIFHYIIQQVCLML